MATLTLFVEADAATAGEALGRASAAVRDVFAVLDEHEIASRDRRTDAISLTPLHERDERGRVIGQVGFRAAQGLALRVRDLDALGGLLDALAGAGVGRLGQVALEIGDRAALIDEARKRAVAEAYRTATLLATEAGVVLGAPLSIELRDEPAARPFARAALAEAHDAMSIAEGEMTVIARVVVAYALE
jgi:uncharacterized protein YggE